MTSKKMFSYVLRLTSNFTDRFLTFPDSIFQKKCTKLFKTCNVGIPSQCKIIQLFTQASQHILPCPTVLPVKSDDDVMVCLQVLNKILYELTRIDRINTQAIYRF